MKTRTFRFAVTASEWAPEGEPVLLRCATDEAFRQAKALGYDALELHLRAPEDLPAERVAALSRETGVAVAAVATGLAKRVDGLCLIDDDPAVRAAAVERLQAFVRWAARVGCRIIVGSMRGNLPRDEAARREADRRIHETLGAVLPLAEAEGVPVVLEAINRYENNYCNTARETTAFLDTFGSPCLLTHLDTFHMNIEEADMAAAIRETGARLGHIHFADNTRHACGDGALDFRPVLEALRDVHYAGYLSVECLPIPDGPTAAARSLAHLQALPDG